MKHVKAMGMNAEDCFICRIVIGFLATPLFLMTGAAMMYAL